MTASLGADEFVRALTAHGQALWVLAAAWVGRNDADDMVQETACVAWERRHQFAAGTDVRAWLSQIARHLGSNWRRRLRAVTGEELTEPIARPPMPAPGWPFDADRSDLPDDLARALRDLPEIARACLLLHVTVGMTFPEIAAMLQIPPATAQSHAQRARVALRAALADRQPASKAMRP